MLSNGNACKLVSIILRKSSDDPGQSVLELWSSSSGSTMNKMMHKTAMQSLANELQPNHSVTITNEDDYDNSILETFYS